LLFIVHRTQQYGAKLHYATIIKLHVSTPWGHLQAYKIWYHTKIYTEQTSKQPMNGITYGSLIQDAIQKSINNINNKLLYWHNGMENPQFRNLFFQIFPH